MPPRGKIRSASHPRPLHFFPPSSSSPFRTSSAFLLEISPFAKFHYERFLSYYLLSFLRFLSCVFVLHQRRIFRNRTRERGRESQKLRASQTVHYVGEGRVRSSWENYNRSSGDSGLLFPETSGNSGHVCARTGRDDKGLELSPSRRSVQQPRQPVKLCLLRKLRFNPYNG